MVTAEIAAALPALLVLLGAALTAVAVITGQLRCVDAAREAARAQARGEPASVAASLVRQVGPRDASITSSGRGERISVTVAATVHPVGGLLPGFHVAATAVAVREPGDPP
ncbi:MAG: TadE family type IV pilus minor pilin [Mycobacteriales bacterium]